MKKGTEAISPRYRGLDVWKDDLEVLGYLRLELSR